MVAELHCGRPGDALLLEMSLGEHGVMVEAVPKLRCQMPGFDVPVPSGSRLPKGPQDESHLAMRIREESTARFDQSEPCPTPSKNSSASASQTSSEVDAASSRTSLPSGSTMVTRAPCRMRWRR
jgi:hypothetical protein